VARAPSATLPHGILSSGALAPAARKLPFVAVALLGAAILLFGLGILPPRTIPHPVAAELLVERRGALALGGLLTLAAGIAAYLLV
jgi:hypothetical protein